MSRTIELIQIDSEFNIVVWGVKEITGVDPSEELDYKLAVNYFSNDEDITQLDIILSYPRRRPLEFSVAFNMKNTATYNALLEATPITLLSSDERNLDNLREYYFNGGTTIILPEDTIEEMKFHKSMFELKKEARGL
ncbi:hypothetical protein AB4Z17_24480 [Paenibacillus sp. TAF43_2]|uniref:hypothetical protein n=1 Tax=Paenibacillus sp. TAF43_2 TaxID=3233069 RepID=UPI003F9AAD20